MRLLLAVLLGSGALLAADRGQGAEYIGGTIPNLGKSEGWIDLTQEERFVFRTKTGEVQIPYDKINLLEYGQQASRRYIAAIVISPLLLLSKKRTHFLTLGYEDEAGRRQAMVFRVKKGHIRSVLVSLEAKTGRKVQYQDEEARKAGKG